jgi:hypothetical protein
LRSLPETAHQALQLLPESSIMRLQLLVVQPLSVPEKTKQRLLLMLAQKQLQLTAWMPGTWCTSTLAATSSASSSMSTFGASSGSTTCRTTGKEAVTI